MDINIDFAPSIVTKSFELYQNHPNPFRKNTTLAFFLPEASEVELILRDETGSVIHKLNEYKSQGYNQLLLTDLPAYKGLIYYQLITQFGSKSGKMIQIK